MTGDNENVCSTSAVTEPHATVLEHIKHGGKSRAARRRPHFISAVHDNRLHLPGSLDQCCELQAKLSVGDSPTSPLIFKTEMALIGSELVAD